MMIDYVDAPLAVGDAVVLCYSPNLWRSIRSRGVVSVVNESAFGVRIGASDRLLRTRRERNVVVTRESDLGVDSFRTLIEQTVELDGDGLVVCTLPRIVDRIEQRNNRRLQVAYLLNVVAGTGTDRLGIETRTTDIGLGGLSFRADRSLSIGDALVLRIGLPDGSAFADAVVAGIEPPMFGGETTYLVRCRFISIEPSVRSRIEQSIKQYKTPRQASPWRFVGRSSSS